MSIQEVVIEPLVSLAQLAEIPSTDGPCVSIFLSGYSPADDAVPFGARLHAALNKVRQDLSSRGGSKLEEGLFPAYLDEFATSHRWEKRVGSLAIFFTSASTRIFQTQTRLSDAVHIGDHFYLRPLLSALKHESGFYILALSKKHVRLLKCNGAGFSAVELPSSMPKSVAEAGAFDPPDHDLENRSAAGPSSSAMHRIHFGTGGEEEKSDQYVANFFRIVDREIKRCFDKERWPLILAAVEEEAALYRRVSLYSHLSEKIIAGSPEHTADRDLYRRTIDTLRHQDIAGEENLLSEFSKQTSLGLTSTDPDSILEASRAGQVGHLLLHEGQAGGGDDDDVLNLIVWETIRHGGQVSMVSTPGMPGGSSIGAILRYRM